MRPARRNNALRSACVATIVPLPGSDKPSASVRQFIEFAVNMPEHDPQVGHAERSILATCSSDTLGSPAWIIASIRSTLMIFCMPSCLPCSASITLPASIGPPDTNTAGIFNRIAAISMPGVILSQFEMQTIASAQCALTIYSTESAISSRDGNEYSIPPWPIAIPSSTAIVLNSLATPPAASISRATICPRSFRCTWPGTNWVNELTTAMIGFSKSPSFMPVARHSARAPAILRPWVVVRERYCGIVVSRQVGLSVVAMGKDAIAGFKRVNALECLA